jgi:hypothetical protein
MVGILGDHHLRHQPFGRQAALDQPRRCRRLHHRAHAAAAGIFGPAGDQDPVLGRHDVEPARDVLADRMQRAGAAGAGRAHRLDHHLHLRQVIGQRRTAFAPATRPLGLQRRVALLLLGLGLGGRALQILEAELELVGVERLGALAELQPSELGDDVVEPLGQRRQPRDLLLEVHSLGL